MKRWLIVLCIMALVGMLAECPSLGSVPAMMSYQGKLVNGSGQSVTDGLYEMRFSLWTQKSGGDLLWSEPSSGTRTVQVTGGIFNVLLGSVNPLVESAFQGNTWLQSEVNGSILLPRVQIVSAGYAIRAWLADGLSLPYTGSTSSDAPAFSVTNTGLGIGLRIEGGGGGLVGVARGTAGLTMGVAGASNSPQGSGVWGENRGGGTGVYGTSSGGTGVYGTSAGGVAGKFTITNSANANPVLQASTTGTGPAIKATAGSGLAGLFEGGVEMAGFRLTTSPQLGYVLTADATGMGTWQPGGLVLPYGATYDDNPGTAFLVRHAGGGIAGEFATSTYSANPALKASTVGAGPAIEATAGSGLAGLFDGTVQMTGFRLGTAAQPGFVLTSDMQGVGTWQRDGLSLPYTGSASSDNAAFWVTNTGTGSGLDGQGGTIGVVGMASQGTGFTRGVLGRSESAQGSGVFGENTNAGTGVYGMSMGGTGVYGSSSGEGIGVHGTSTDGRGVYGYSDYGAGVYASTGGGVAGKFEISDSTNANPALQASTIGSGPAVHAVNSGSGKAGLFEGDVHVAGNLTVSGHANASLPIAYAFINPDGSKGSGTSNVSAVWNETDRRYEVAISGESYQDPSYVTTVTPMGTAPLTAATVSVSGSLIVQLFNNVGDPMQSAFQFVTYKP